MKGHTFRQRVVESTLSLPIVATMVAVLWMLPNLQQVELWAGLGWAALMSYIVVEWNNQYQLLRIRSRMNSVIFMTLLLAFPMLHEWSLQLLPALCLLLSHFLLFRTYGESRPQGYVFYAFLLIGVGSCLFPPLLLFVPFVYFALGRQLRAITRQSLSASLFGLFLPALGLMAFWVYEQRFDFHTLCEWMPLPVLAPQAYLLVPLSQWVALAVLALLDAMSVAHFVRTSFNDKIRTRQYYYFLLVQHLPLWFIALLLPQHFASTLPLLLLHCTPFAAHYFALARGRWMNAWFIFWCSLLALLALCNYFDLWTLFSNFS